MKFKSLKNALDRQEEIERSLTELDTAIETRSAEGKADGVSNEDLTKIVDEVKLKVEERNALLVELDEVKANIEEIETSRNEQLGLLSELSTERIEEKRNMKKENDIELRSTQGYLEAWATSVREGNNEAIQRFMSTNDSGDSTGGGILVPTILENRIETAIRTGGTIVQLCNITSMRGITEIPFEIDATDAQWHEEGGTAPDEEIINIGSILLKPKNIKKWIRVTDEMEAMAISAFADYLVEEMTEKILTFLDDAIIAAPQATNGVQGITTNTNPLFFNKIDEDLTFSTGFSAMAKLGRGVQARAVAVMHQETYFNGIMKLKDLSNAPIYSVHTDPTMGPQYYYGGMRVIFTEALKAYNDPTITTNDVYMVIGDFGGGYRLNFPEGYGIKFKRDDLTEAEKDLVKYVGRMFVAGNIARIKRFVGVTKA